MAQWQDVVMKRQGKDTSSPAVTIIGGGPVGYLAALSLVKRDPNLSIRLIAGRRTPAEDGRAAALVGRSIEILADLDLDRAFQAKGAPLAAIRIIDVTGRLLRAPTTTFRASDAGLDAFGISLSTAGIVQLLADAADHYPNIDVQRVDVTSITRDDTGFQLTLDTGETHQACFLVAADGQKSMAREAAGISVRRWDYPQVAMTFAVSHPRDHEDISTEFHTSHGPFTLVPAGNGVSTVVWMTAPEEAKRLMALDDAGFALAAEKTCRSILGRFQLVSKRGAYPMAGLMAERFTDAGIALIGETAHAFPPIGAQGLNLGFRDADTLADALINAINAGRKPDDPDYLDHWNADRLRDAGMRTAGVDLFNRSLLTDFLPVNAARGLGLMALKQIPPLRRAVMRSGLGS
ncbi:MAG: FAD-dependent monooxygenase [Beijerinckiaceae bacterium]